TLTEPGATGPAEPSDGESGEEAGLPLAGMSVVATGSMSGPLEGLSRTQVNELIERAGGKASSSVSARTSLLVAGEKAGSKKAKAEQFGIEITTPEEFASRVTAFL
ncbi:MAG: BRCT domain-containing protein, partial [Spirillospora sp.]